MSIQKEIKAGLKNIKLHKWRYDGGETCFFLNDSDVKLILKYLDSKDVRVRTQKAIEYRGREMAWPRYERLIEE